MNTSVATIIMVDANTGVSDGMTDEVHVKEDDDKGGGRCTNFGGWEEGAGMTSTNTVTSTTTTQQ